MTKHAEVLRRAARLFAKHDRLRAEMRQLDNEIRQACRDYDMASGCRGIRPESLRIAAENHGFINTAA